MKWLSIILIYFEPVLNAVIAVETALQSAPGASKKQLVLDAIASGAQAFEQIPEAHVQGIAALIDTIVGTLNKSGVFGHAAAPAK